jgi:hypothetical protein
MKRILSLILIISVLVLQTTPCSAFQPLEINLVTDNTVLSENNYLCSYTGESYIAGMGIRGAFNAQDDPNLTVTQEIAQGVAGGLLSGVTNVGMQYISEEADIDPLYTALGARAITGAINGMISEDHDILKGIFEAYKNSTINLLTLGSYNSDNSAWATSVYASKVLDFAHEIESSGLDSAIKSYATGIFHRDSANNVAGLIMNIGKIRTPDDTTPVQPNDIEPQQTTLDDGTAALKYELAPDKIIYTTLDGSEIVAVQDGNEYKQGAFVVIQDENGEVKFDNVFLKDGIIKVAFPNGATGIQYVDNHLLTHTHIVTPDGRVIEADPYGDKGYIEYDSYGDYVEAEIIILSEDYSFTIHNGKIESLASDASLIITDSDKEYLINNYEFTEQDIDSMTIETSNDHNTYDFKIYSQNGLVFDSTNENSDAIKSFFLEKLSNLSTSFLNYDVNKDRPLSLPETIAAGVDAFGSFIFAMPTTEAYTYGSDLATLTLEELGWSKETYESNLLYLGEFSDSIKAEFREYIDARKDDLQDCISTFTIKLGPGFDCPYLFDKISFVQPYGQIFEGLSVGYKGEDLYEATFQQETTLGAKIGEFKLFTTYKAETNLNTFEQKFTPVNEMFNFRIDKDGIFEIPFSYSVKDVIHLEASDEFIDEAIEFVLGVFNINIEGAN